MAVGRAERWVERLPMVEATFGDDHEMLQRVSAVLAGLVDAARLAV